jgi:rod shape-determining protein MreB
VKHDLFISHASEDKEAVARPLAAELRQRGYTVWFDNFSLGLGDVLSRSIDQGLAESRYGVVILSHRFFAKNWPQKELSGLVSREILSGDKVILPVWHNVTQAEVAKHSPTLADRLAANTAVGIRQVAEEIAAVIGPPMKFPPTASITPARLQSPTRKAWYSFLVEPMFAPSVAVDISVCLGNTTISISLHEQGIVLLEPSIIAVNPKTNQLVGVGDDAVRALADADGDIIGRRPVKDEVIGDFKAAEALLSACFERVKTARHFNRFRVLATVPAGVNEVERRALKDAISKAGACEVHLLDEPLAAAIGADLPVQDPSCRMLTWIGEGHTAAAIFHRSRIVICRTVRVANDEFDEAIIQYMKRAYNLMIGERTAEDIKIKIGSAYPLKKETTMEVKGRDLVAGLPKTLTITSQEVREALLEPISTIVDCIRAALENCPPELSADLVDNGFVVAGGGASLPGLDRLLQEEIGIPVRIAEDPGKTLARGAERALRMPAFFPPARKT